MEMPPLPYTTTQLCDAEGGECWGEGYTPDEMRAYGESCARMAREEAAKELPLPAATFREGNWSHPDGGRIVGWHIPAADVERMGTDAYCLPREISEALAQLAAIRKG